jgi:Skp family chaperone for outer membrane proteins
MTKPAVALKLVRDKQPEIFATLDQLAKAHGEDLFRVIGQRYFKQMRERKALEQEIKERQAELQRLQGKAERAALK